MKVLLSHPTGNHNVRQALQAFAEADQLLEFCTTIAWNERSPVSKALPLKARAQLSRRSYQESLQVVTRTHPTLETARLLFSAVKWNWPIRHEVGPFSIDAVCRSLDMWVARRLRNCKLPPSTVYCYEDAAKNTFETATELGIRRIYEHPVGYWREVQRVFEEERDLQPEYTPIIAGIKDSYAKRERKDLEIAYADLVIAPSQYSAKTLQNCPTLGAPVAIVNYGAPLSTIAEISIPPDRLRVLFVGSLQQRKGISYLIQACNQVASAIEVSVVGAKVADCSPVDQWLSFTSWTASAPHGKVLEIMSNCDVLVLPSLSEGFGLVVLEAMSQGLTVIVSENTGAADVIQDGINGYIVPIRSSEAIAEKLETLHRNPELLMSMKAAALDTAKILTWERYRRQLLDSIRLEGASL